MALPREITSGSPRGAGPRQMDHRALILLGVAHLSDDINQGALPAMLPFFIAAHDLSYSAAAGLVLAMTVSSSVLQPVLGQFSDRHSAPWLVPAGLLLAGAGVALATVMPTYLLIALAAGLSGIGLAAFHPEAARFANYSAGTRRATGMSIFALGGNLGFAAGPLLATQLMLLLGLSGGTLLVLPAAVTAALLTWQLPRFGAHRRAALHRGAAAGAHAPDAWRPFAILTGAIISRSIMLFGLNTFVPLYYLDVLNAPLESGGIALTILFTFGAAGTFLGGWLSDRFGKRRVIILAMGALTLLMPALTLLHNPTAVMLLLAPIGLTLFMPMSVMVVMGQEYLPNRIGTASGVTQGLALSAGGLVAPVLGGIADAHGIGTVLTLLAFMPPAAMGFVAALPAEKHRKA